MRISFLAYFFMCLLGFVHVGHAAETAGKACYFHVELFDSEAYDRSDGVPKQDCIDSRDEAANEFGAFGLHDCFEIAAITWSTGAKPTEFVTCLTVKLGVIQYAMPWGDASGPHEISYTPPRVLR